MYNLKDKFPELEFYEDTHTYYVSGEKYPSVSSLISNFYEPFNTDGIAMGYARKHGFDVEEVKQAWKGKSKRSTDAGTEIHKFGEDYAYHRYFGIGEKPVVLDKQCLGIVQFWNDLPDRYTPVELELQMYSKLYKYCGTADKILYDYETDSYVISDWKTNESLTSDYNKNPLFHIPEELGLVQDGFGKYTLQFSFYQILLEEVGVKVTDRILVWLQEQEDKKLYKTFHTKDVTEHLRKWLIQNMEDF